MLKVNDKHPFKKIIKIRFETRSKLHLSFKRIVLKDISETSFIPSMVTV